MTESEKPQVSPSWRRLIRYELAWILVRPYRWAFRRMVFASTPRWLPERVEGLGWLWPNIHWWVLYRTVFKFCKWLWHDAWRPLCQWGERSLKHKPWYAAVIQRIGETTAGGACQCFECYHCASKDGCQIDLSSDETGTTFKLERTWTSSTEDGTDYRFSGTTICPRCGFEDHYEDGSL